MQILEVTGFWVRSAIITLQRPGTPLEFVLFPMVHVASPGFYADVRRRLAECDLIVAEGVTGESREVSAITLAYRFSPRLRRDLEEQDYETILPPRAPVLNADMTAGQVEAELRKLPWPLHVMLLVAAPVMGLVFAVCGPRVFYTKDLEIDDLPLTVGAEELREGPVWEALVDKRDQIVLAALEQVYAKHCEDAMRVAVVYGAGHMPGIAAGLRARHGYLPRRADWVVVA